MNSRREDVVQPLWLLVAGCWIWMVWACAGEWSNNQDYNYGWFVAPLALYFWWKRSACAPSGSGVTRGGERPMPAVTSDKWPVTNAPSGERRWLAWVVIAGSLLLIWPVEVVRQTPIHWRPVLWTIGLIAFANTLAVTWLTGGRAAMRRVAFPAAFMFLAIPWPTFLENAVSFPLMQLVTRWSVGILHLLGYPATAAGTTIMLPNCTVGVEEACSGLRSLQTALMVGFAAGELARLRLPARCALLLVAFAMALAGNQLRVIVLALAGISGGNEAVKNIHDIAGYMVLTVLLVGVGSAAWVMEKVGPRDEESKRPKDEERNEARGGGTRANQERHEGAKAEKREGEKAGRPESGRAGWLVLGIAVAAMVVAHGWFWWRGSLAAPPVPAMLSPANSGDFQADANVPGEILGILQPDEYRYIREVRDGVPGKVAGYHFYWRPRKGNANQLYHRPDACMPGAGWRLDGKVTRQVLDIGGREMSFNVFPFRSPAGPALMLWGSYLNGEPVEIEFNNDVYVNTANLAQFIRTGTRLYSYEVAALIMPHEEGQRPSAEQIEAFANRVFTATAQQE